MAILVLAFGIKCFRHLLKRFGNVVRRTISYDIGFFIKIRSLVMYIYTFDLMDRYFLQYCFRKRKKENVKQEGKRKRRLKKG